MQRSVLPLLDRKPVSLTTYTAKDPDTRFPPIRLLRPAAGAPNVLIVLIDDAGFGASSAFGGPCQTPVAEIATSAPGYNSLRPNTCAPLAEILNLNGYSTAQFGKCHEVPVFEATPIGRTTAGLPARASSASTGSSAARRASTLRRSMTAPRRSCRSGPPKKATT
jgi:arylsulfatase